MTAANAITDPGIITQLKRLLLKRDDDLGEKALHTGTPSVRRHVRDRCGLVSKNAPTHRVAFVAARRHRVREDRRAQDLSQRLAFPDVEPGNGT
jgi:hypothetical protein